MFTVAASVATQFFNDVIASSVCAIISRVTGCAAVCCWDAAVATTLGGRSGDQLTGAHGFEAAWDVSTAGTSLCLYSSYPFPVSLSGVWPASRSGVSPAGCDELSRVCPVSDDAMIAFYRYKNVQTEKKLS